MPLDMPDVIVLIPGILGSVLERGERQVWGPSLGLWTSAVVHGGRDISDALTLPDARADDPGSESIRATRVFPDVHLLPGIWKIDGYSGTRERLFDRYSLVEGENYFEFPYDWRLDNRIHARRLHEESRTWLERRRQRYPGAQLILVAHSMGGLIARYFMTSLGGWSDVRALFTFGTPFRGSVNSLLGLVNGTAKLGGLIDFTTMVRSFPSMYQLLPTFECYDAGNGRRVRVDAVDIPNLNRDHARAGLEFHREMDDDDEVNTDPSYRNRARVFPIVGVDQRTFTAALTAQGSRIEGLRDYSQSRLGGDGTVPQVSALAPTVQRMAMYTATKHSCLQTTQAVLVQVVGVLTSQALERVPVLPSTPPIGIRINVDDLFLQDQAVVLHCERSDPGSTDVTIELRGADPAPCEVRRVAAGADDAFDVNLGKLPAGSYRVTAFGTNTEKTEDVFVVAGLK